MENYEEQPPTAESLAPEPNHDVVVELGVAVAADTPRVDHNPQESAQGTELETFTAEVAEALPDDFHVNPRKRLIYYRLTEDKWIKFCGLINVKSMLRQTDGIGWARMIEFMDLDGRIRRQVVDEQSLIAGGAKLAKLLVDQGFDLRASPTALVRLVRQIHTASRVWSTAQPGWVDIPGGRSSFVLPDGRVIAAGDVPSEQLEYTGSATKASTAGSLQKWQSEVAAPAEGNPLLVLALCAAFAAPLLRLTEIDVIGYNLYGKTSCGKSTAARVALSTYAGSGGLNQWNATAAGIELLALRSTDGVLVLDEFPSAPGRQVVDSVYTLGNATGRARSSSTLTLRDINRWRNVVISTSETTVREAFEQKKIDLPAGVAVRLIEIPANSWAHGVFQNLHGHPDGHALSAALYRSTEANHGHALPHFLNAIVPTMASLRAAVDQSLATTRQKLLDAIGLQNVSAPGTVERIIDRFALLMVAGELAIQTGTLPWPEDTAETAITEVAQLWYASFKRAQTPDAAETIERMRSFLRLISDRLVDLDGPGDDHPDPTGWTTAEWVYVESDAFRLHLERDPEGERTVQDLIKCGALVPGGESRSHQYRLPARLVGSRPRVYRFRRQTLDW